MIGAVLGNRYEILEVVGTGGMANVYKAKCTLLNRNVAIKVLKEEFKDDEEIIKRFNIESQAVAGLSHTNIVSVFDVGTEGDLHYIVMEYVEGITLKDYLKDSGALPWDKAVDFAIQICSALQHAHRKGIVHRDIKPQNIMVTKDDVLKVMDFGIARAVSSYTMKIDTEAIGTAHYCSPEQAKGIYTDERSDIYSLGVVMYEMLTGKLPFESDSSVSVALKQIQENPVPPTEIVPSIPASVEAAVLKAMEKDAVERFQTSNTLLIELNWIKQTETAPKTVKKAPITEEEKFATKKIDIQSDITAEEEIKETEEKDTGALKENENMNKELKKTKTKSSSAKEDKKSVIAAILSAVGVVAVLSFVMVYALFGNFWSGNKVQTTEVPNVIGYELSDVQEKYKDIEFVIDSEEYSSEYDEGIIIDQSPSEGETMPDPAKITITVSKGFKSVEIPDIINLDMEVAIQMLDSRNINYRISEEINDTIPEGIVISVDPGVGKTVTSKDKIVEVVVSAGDNKEYATVPNVVGKSQSDAEEMITQEGLKVKVSEIASDKTVGTVVKQSQPAGSKVELEETIIIYVSKGGGSTNSGESAKEVTVYLPQDKETATVKVVVGDKVAYEKVHNCSEGAVSVVVRGTGSQRVVTYVDNVIAGERVLDFD